MPEGFGTTFCGESVGPIRGLKEVNVGGTSINIINYALLESENRSTQNLEGVITSGPITATIIFSKDVYGVLKDNQKSGKGDIWTLIIDGRSIKGKGFILDISEPPFIDSDGKKVFDLVIQPENKWEKGRLLIRGTNAADKGSTI